MTGQAQHSFMLPTAASRGDSTMKLHTFAHQHREGALQHVAAQAARPAVPLLEPDAHGTQGGTFGPIEPSVVRLILGR
jgi:hypothetical protein